MATFITPQRLTTFLRYPASDPVTQDSADLAEEVALGWLSGVTQVEDWQSHTEDPVVKAWVLELAGIAYENPTSMTQDQAGEVQSAWQRDRRSQILDAAAAWAARKGLLADTTATLSRGSFPPAQPWPDQARGRW